MNDQKINIKYISVNYYFSHVFNLIFLALVKIGGGLKIKLQKEINQANLLMVI